MERKLWKFLRNKQVDGYRFRQQHGYGPYVLDFYCPKLRLCIELDGNVHDDIIVQQKDKERTEFLKENKIHVLRFRNEEVESDIENVIGKVKMFIKENCSDPLPPNLGGPAKMVVLDDDPTGIQTVHGCLLITEWDEEHVREAFADAEPFFYILTNTRAMTRDEAARVTQEAMEMVIKVNEDYGYRLIIVSRSDSCLRGHFPLETDVMRQCLVDHGYTVADKIPFCPAFIEAGRFTIDGTHYMQDGDRLIPVSETEFARDNVFAYHTSVLRDYIREKSANPDDYTIVNAQSYDELRQWWNEERRAWNKEQGTKDEQEAIVIRSSSSLPKVIAGIPDIPLLDKTILPSQDTLHTSRNTPPLFIVGSHVQKTTRQLERLLKEEGTCAIEVDVQRIIDDADALMLETCDLIWQVADQQLAPVVYTSRQEIRLDNADQRQHLGQQVSDFLVGIVRRCPYTPSYLVGKGGITSHDILTKGLGVKSARVLGQIVPSVPCVMTRDFPYIIFPGNVGGEDSLRDVYRKLQ